MRRHEKVSRKPGCLFSNSFNKGSKKLLAGKLNSSKAQAESEVCGGTDQNQDGKSEAKDKTQTKTLSLSMWE